MAASKVERKLSAILSADVQGYSRLMGADEEATLGTLRAYREVFSETISRHRGRVVNAPGDALLAEFASVVDAIAGAAEIQRELAERNAELAPERRMLFRIGVNLGDVMVADEAIYGDGVNIAARLESLAEGGGICISGSAYDQVEGKLPLHYKYLGRKRVKNILRPVRTYRVLSQPGGAAHRVLRAKALAARSWRKAVVALAVLLLAGGGWFALDQRDALKKAPSELGGLPLPEKPSIVVLPFANLSGDGKEDYFADGITHEIITKLARVPGLFVIARTSSFAYKSRRVRVDQVGRELGVRYVLEGSFQKAGERIRVAAQLVEASTGRNLWSNTYERRMKDIFDLQDDITRNIVTALEVKLTEGEQARVWHRATSNLKAWDYFVQGVVLLRRLKPEETRQAKAAFKKAIDLDPNSAGAITGLGLAHFVEAKNGWSKSVTGSLQSAADLARRAIRIDETLGEPYSLLGSIHLVKRQHAQAILLGKKAVALTPNGAEATALLAMILNFSGRPREALKMARRAMRLSPNYPHWYLYHLGLANYLIGKYQPATEAFAGVLDRDANSPITHMMLVASYAAARRWKEARAEAVVFRGRDFGLTPAEFLPRVEPHKEPAILKKVLADLAKAGLR